MNQRIFYNIKNKYPYINNSKLNILPSAIMDIPFTIKIQCGTTVMRTEGTAEANRIIFKFQCGSTVIKDFYKSRYDRISLFKFQCGSTVINKKIPY